MGESVCSWSLRPSKSHLCEYITYDWSLDWQLSWKYFHISPNLNTRPGRMDESRPSGGLHVSVLCFGLGEGSKPSGVLWGVFWESGMDSLVLVWMQVELGSHCSQKADPLTLLRTFMDTISAAARRLSVSVSVDLGSLDQCFSTFFESWHIF